MKNVKILAIIFLLLLIVIFSILKIIEYTDAHTEFRLNENTFIVDYVDIPIEGGLASGNTYYEIDLDKKIIDYRYDFEYWDIPNNSWFKKTFGNKKRKLKHRYYINDDIVNEVKNLFSEITQTYTNKEISQNQITDINTYFDYYLLKSNKGNYNIKDKNKINNIRQILNKIKN